MNEAIRDARSHLEKGTGLSDEAVRRICLALLLERGEAPREPVFCEIEECEEFAEANLRRCRAHEGG